MYSNARRSSIAASSRASSACTPIALLRAPRLTALRREPLPLYRGPLPLNPCLCVAPQAISLFRKPLRLIQASKTRHGSPKRVANCYNTHESMSQASIPTGAMGCSCCHGPRASRHRARRGAIQDEKQDRVYSKTRRSHVEQEYIIQSTIYKLF